MPSTPCRVVLAALCLYGCTESPTVSHEDVSVTVSLSADSLQWGTSSQASVAIVDDRGRPVAGAGVVFSSSDDDILAVSQSGVVAALRPGFAFLKAQAGGGADSVGIRVVTSSCPPLDVVESSENGFSWTRILPGSTQNAETPSGFTEYQGVPFFWGSGLLYGTSPDTMLAGADYSGLYRDFTGGVCRNGDHSIALLAKRTQGVNIPGADVPGLVVVQEDWALDGGFLIFRYTFQNAGHAPIRNLRIGFVSDYDVYSPDDNVASFDPATAAASVVAADSTQQPITAGMIVLGVDVESYRMWQDGQVVVDRSGYYAELAPGALTASRSSVGDVKQLLSVGQFDLAAGQSLTLGYALVVGADRSAFDANVAAARLRFQQGW